MIQALLKGVTFLIMVDILRLTDIPIILVTMDGNYHGDHPGNHHANHGKILDVSFMYFITYRSCISALLLLLLMWSLQYKYIGNGTTVVMEYIPYRSIFRL